MKVDNGSPDFWYLRPPFVWLPTEEQLTVMEKDYSTIQLAAVKEDWPTLRGAGSFLTLNTADSTTAKKTEAEKGRAWWLKKELTREICLQNLWPKDRLTEL